MSEKWKGFVAFVELGYSIKLQCQVYCYEVRYTIFLFVLSAILQYSKM